MTVQGQASLEREVRVPDFEARTDITPRDVESVSVTRRGKSKRGNDEIVTACPTQGRTQFRVAYDNGALRAAWLSGFAAIGPAKAECVRTALQRDRGAYAASTEFDLPADQAVPMDAAITMAMARP